MASFDLHKNERTSFGYDMNTETETDRELLEEEECCEDDRLPEPRLGVTCSCGHCHHGHGAEEDEDGHAEHHHSHEHGHGHSHEEDDEAHEKKERLELIAGAGLFALALILHFLVLKESAWSWPVIAVLVLAYLILGKDVLLTSGRNIAHGEVFDENFLMSIATLGAFAIGEYPEAVGVMLFFRLGEMFEDMAVERSRKKILETVNLRAETVILAETGEEIPAARAKVGDVVLVKPGDRVPLDGIVVEGESFLDTSAITGEPVPVRVEKNSGILAGCVNTQGVLKVLATKKLSESMTSRILHSVEEAQEQKPQLEHFITRFARVYTPIVVGLALFVALAMPLIRGEAFRPWLYTAISFLVMSCPCALVVSVPLAFFCGIGTASGKGILFKGGSAVEALSKARAAVLDKTGTVTEGTFSVQEVLTQPGFAEDEILRLAAACEAFSRHPIGKSICEAARERGLKIPAARSMEEKAGRGISALAEGRRVLCGNAGLLEQNGVTDVREPEIAGTRVLVAVDGVFAGTILIADAVKKDAKASLQRLRRLGLTTVMLTGDAAVSAEAVAQDLEIDRVKAGLLPEEKLAVMQAVRGELGGVLFVGDGLNDAPVLAGADIGAAMGSGADAAIEAADLVFMNSNVSAIPQAVSLSRRCMRIASENVGGALAIKIIVMLLGITRLYSNMWLAVFADTGVLFLCILNSLRLLRWKE
ncbi:MAG: cadmium-translocating P-type ATPase [Lachnospiraceae bacterium]|nr:cadmium-translocating P-type ATPase [Lachnospiraceae bacterium]